MTLAGIVVFVYNRPSFTMLLTLEALMLNELAGESHLFIYLDDWKKESDCNAN